MRVLLRTDRWSGPAVLVLVAVFAAGLFLPAISDAQITRGAISGVVRDTSGAVIPGASVTVINMDTNVSRATVSNTQGFYSVAALEPGRYMVRAELAGFSTTETPNVTVRSATEVTVDVELRVAGVGEEVTVTAEATAIQLDKSSPTIGTTLNERQVIEFPLPGGRNINNLIATSPNVSVTTGQGTFAAAGQRSRNNNYMIDGSDNNDISVTISTSPVVPEAVAEFQVITNAYSVEFGRNSGAQVNVITKSGTNRFRGDAWNYHTNSKFYSLTNIEKDSGLDKPAEFKRNQAGFDLGGPIVRDRTFFFGLYQWDGQRPVARPGGSVRIPTQAGFAALQNVPLGAGQPAASRQAVLQQLQFLQNIYGQGVTFRTPQNVLVNGVPIETGLTNVNILDPSTYHTYLGRVDHRLTNNDNVTFRYSYTPREDINAISNCSFGETFCGFQSLKDTNLAASNTHIFTSRLLNEFRFSLVRRDLSFPENDPVTPTTTISGLFTIGGLSNFPQGRVSSAYQFSNTSTWTRERHTLKFGVDIRRNILDNQAAFNSKGSFTFNNLQDYMNNNAFAFTQALQVASFVAKQWQSYFFLQDDFRVTPELTLNLGLRYEISGAPLGFFGATDQESLNALVPGPVQMDKNNWAPRVGFAYSPRSQNRLLGDGLTVMRGGFGVGYDVLFYNLLTVNASNFPRVVTAQQNNVQHVFPNLLPVTAEPVFNPLATYVNSHPDTQNPMTRFWSADVQREFGNIVVQLGYTGSRGYHGINQQQMNPALLTEAQRAAAAAGQAIPGVQARRLHPQFGARIMLPSPVGPDGVDAEARSSYHGMFIRADKRYARGLQFGGSYTFSKFMSNNDASLGEAGTAQSPQTPQNYFDIGPEWSRSAFDRPHRIAVNYLWELPGPRTGVLGAIIGGWQFAGVTWAQSGQPFTIRTGVDSNGDGNAGPDRPNVDPSGSFVWNDNRTEFTNNGFYVTPRNAAGSPQANAQGDGNAGRNSERGAPRYNTDFSLSKRFRLGGQRSFQIRADAFNALNQPNYGIPVNLMNSPSFGQNTNNWGRRSIQFSGKFSF
jgi:hypothetical protein